MNKICTSCCVEQPVANFSVRRASRDGLALICRGCAKIKKAAYYAINKTAIKAKVRKWCVENPDRRRAIAAKWDNENRDQKRTTARVRQERLMAEDPERERAKRLKAALKWQAKNPAKVAIFRKRSYQRAFERDPEKVRAKARASEQKRRALIRGTEGSWTLQDVEKLIIGQKNKCWWCHIELNGRYDVDHRIPLARGGTNKLSNLVISCARCNRSKAAKMPWEFAGVLL